ncbi:pentapeptide repeat-containing protein [Rugamonas sp.]|uniref:pentapeptide repeat-containing protein n=1 Tax=Rugamonas sp. TaxID=1926287 RepID=UPI0025DEF64F|nr:pentapeptide repeat-containing protein [Rugamonas sp.]
MKIEIKNRWSGNVIFSHDVADNSMAITVSAARATDSDLRDSNLRGSNLSGSDLSGSNLRGSDLSGSDLSGSDLSGSDLSGANLLLVRDDIWAVLSSAPREVPALIEALKAGNVDGSTYHGDCSCLVGTLGRARGADVHALGSLKPNSSRPAERFFMGIRKGDTPETSQFSALALVWSAEWLATMQAAFQGAVEVTV